MKPMIISSIFITGWCGGGILYNTHKMGREYKLSVLMVTGPYYGSRQMFHIHNGVLVSRLINLK